MENETLKYTFKVKDFTPETMPFGRLVEYYAEISKMLGVSENIHLVDIFESSHGSNFAIDRNYQTKMTKRLMGLQDGTAPNAALKARQKIDGMLREDGTCGEFADDRGENVIDFPGMREVSESHIRIRDAATFLGNLYYIAGSQSDAKVRINTQQYGVVYCTTTKEIAKALRDFLFEDVKVSGWGTWIKTSRGWDIDNFSITDFAPVKKETLRQAIDRLREIDVNWTDDSPIKESGR